MWNQEMFDSRPKVKKLNILPKNPENNQERKVSLGRFPSWLHRSIPKGNTVEMTGRIMREGGLHTVCEEAKCPNILECWSKKTATYLIMGKSCTRNCGFCDIDFSHQPSSLDEDEPRKVANSVALLGLKHVVITMVARDDLVDGGAQHLRQVIEEIRIQNAGVTVEVLTSDLEGKKESIDIVLKAQPEIFNHNIETVRSLTPRVRHKATYDRTLSFLKYLKEKELGRIDHSDLPSMWVKSGLMVGLGEKEEEVFETLRDLYSVGCDIVTIGQYLQASQKKLRVKEFIHPDQFEKYAVYGRSLGIRYMHCGPRVRSSYNASEVLNQVNRVI